MSLQPIPEAWRTAVISALKARKFKFTGKGWNQWQNGFPGAFRQELVDDFVSALSMPNVSGCPVQMDYPEGQTWEFWFSHMGFKAYGKILLETDQMNLLIQSAHHPRKPKLSCE